jgi:hypothetical protein
MAFFLRTDRLSCIHCVGWPHGPMSDALGFGYTLRVSQLGTTNKSQRLEKGRRTRSCKHVCENGLANTSPAGWTGDWRATPGTQGESESTQ